MFFFSGGGWCSWCIGGDWNVIKFLGETRGGCKITSNMKPFSDLINVHSILELWMSRANFTWSIIKICHPCVDWIDFLSQVKDMTFHPKCAS